VLNYGGLRTTGKAPPHTPRKLQLAYEISTCPSKFGRIHRYDRRKTGAGCRNFDSDLRSNEEAPH